MVEERMREKVIFKKKTSSNLIYELLCQASNIATWYEGPMHDLIRKRKFDFCCVFFVTHSAKLNGIALDLWFNEALFS